MTLWNLNSSTLHKEPPLIRGSSTAHKGSSLMAGGGAVYLNFDTGHGEISSNPAISVKKMMRSNAASLMVGGGAHKDCSVFAPHQLCKGPSTAYKGLGDILH